MKESEIIESARKIKEWCKDNCSAEGTIFTCECPFNIDCYCVIAGEPDSYYGSVTPPDEWQLPTEEEEIDGSR